MRTSEWSLGAYYNVWAFQNPAILNGWKRKRHSGGNGPAPGLTSHAEEHQDIFTFDEHEVHGYERNEAGFLGEDEGNVTDGMYGLG